MFVYFIGTGASEGNPNYLCGSMTCSEARDYAFARRKPSSILVIGEDEEQILIDAGCDVTEYLNVPFDAILLTHWHHDHTAGLYRLRWMEGQYKTPLYAPERGADEQIVKSPKNLEIKFVEPFKPFKVLNMKITPLKLNHVPDTFGYLLEERGKAIAILTDTKGLPMETEIFLTKKKIDLAIIDATFAPDVNRDGHNNVDMACKIGQNINAKKVILTHIAYHNLMHTELVEYVKSTYGENFDIAYDGRLEYI